MTDGGLAVLRVLAEGEARTASEIGSLAGMCERKTRGSLVGCLVGGLVEEEISDARRWRITEQGLALLAESGSS